ncbi:hypothetical protein DL93DRAFT_2084494 [Clavulina sp. PMI_390]|nr:hypothetical protein DL93DRAFT_2084494 [Clavulina sp. PMI_390]
MSRTASVLRRTSLLTSHPRGPTPLLAPSYRPGLARTRLALRAFSWSSSRHDSPTSSSTSSPASPNLEIKPAKPGTAPPYSALLVLHTSTPASEWPSHPSVYSPLTKELLARLKKYSGMVNMSHDHTLSADSDLAFPNEVNEAYPATLYLNGMRAIRIPSVSMDSIDAIELLMQDLQKGQPKFNYLAERHVYVCTHNARDCRCGTIGVDVQRALSTIFSDAPSTSESSSPPSAIPPTPSRTPTQVHGISHVGGHIYAANIYDFPSGDMYATVSLDNVALFAEALSADARPLGEDVITGSGSGSEAGGRTIEQTRFLLDVWRGRMDMSREEQVAYAADLRSRLDVLERERELAAAAEAEAEAVGEVESATLAPLRRGASPVPEKEKSTVKIVFEKFHGDLVILNAPLGKSVMEVAKEEGLVEGTCGGELECATCHVYIDPAATTTTTASTSNSPFPEKTEAEEDMLDYAISPTDFSRLSCQIPVSQELGAWCEGGGLIKLPKY